MKTLRKKLIIIYGSFFKVLGIDNKGILISRLQDKQTIKFPAYPYMGSKYQSSRKILIIGLDIGTDEKLEGIMSFEERRKIIEEKNVSKHNPHIAGTYICALFFLKDEKNWGKYWEKIKNEKSCQKALRSYNLPNENPLSFIAFTNYYKFVTLKRSKRTGGENRKYENRQEEEKLLINEIRVLRPDIVIFQGSNFKNKKYTHLINMIKTQGAKVYVGPHPSYRGKREPEFFINQLQEI